MLAQNDPSACLRDRGVDVERGYGDPTRKSKPNEVGNFDLRGSVCAGLTGRFAVSVAQVRASSNTVEGVLFVAIFAVVVRR
jgi:hypothetical protein